MSGGSGSAAGSARTARVRSWRQWSDRHVFALVRGVALGGLALLELMMFVLEAIAVLSCGLGLVFALPAAVEHGRWLPNLCRQLARDWSGVDIPEPYRPRPPAPVPGPDGLYRDGCQLYRTPRMPAFNRRWNWVIKDPATWRDLAWLLLNPVIGGVLVLLPAGLFFYGIWMLAVPGVWQTFAGVDPSNTWYGLVAGSPVAAVPVGVAMALLGFVTGPRALLMHAHWTRVLLAPTERARLAQRVRELTESRAEATDARAAELRRIERDLHDGAQARLVAMGMTLGAVERLMGEDPAAARALVAEAREASAQALAEIRDLVRGIHPPVLADRGLGDAVRALALDCPLKVEVTVDLPGRVEAPIESAAYFAVSEVLTNAVKHAGARRVWVDLRHENGLLRITVTDDGRGGATVPDDMTAPDGSAAGAHGSGLRGIERRLATFDGVLALSSPRGGPTRVTMEIPCALSSPRTSTY